MSPPSMLVRAGNPKLMQALCWNWGCLQFRGVPGDMGRGVGARGGTLLDPRCRWADGKQQVIQQYILYRDVGGEKGPKQVPRSC
jgi:hypothetical protein